MSTFNKVNYIIHILKLKLNIFNITYLFLILNSITGCSDTNDHESYVTTTIKQYQNDTNYVFTTLGEYDINKISNINLINVAQKTISFQTNFLTIHSETMYYTSSKAQLFIILRYNNDSTIKTLSPKLGIYTAFIASGSNNIDIDGKIFAFLINGIGDTINQNINLIISDDTHSDTLLINPSLNTLVLNKSLSINSSSLSFIGTEDVKLYFKNNTNKTLGVIWNHYYSAEYGLYWDFKIMDAYQTKEGGSGGFPLSEQFQFYVFSFNF